MSLSLQRYPILRAWSALSKMGSDHAVLRRVPGVRFYRLMGTGRGADLVLAADLRRWARVIVWEDRAAFEAFERGAWRTRERALTSESCTFVLAPSRWHGRWGGRDPFAGAEPAEATGTVAVLTRGTIRVRSLRSFWRAVPGSQANLPGAAGLIASVAVGETPLVQSATFSVWRDVEAVRAFAYGAGGGHLDVVRRTRSEGWYGEEMFARFAVLDARGTWDGRDVSAWL